ncbi:hypothetical protein [Crocosphaera sp. XPORK-15E]|uniref:hypothetical protein n=1 Tax=Crocosphaera sp. XPORK-15E TaxID=3110247 RepID=UPI002B210B8C|nr:hypothetical protein [Crocosphaera sp. XPORK-15E]MEA5533993.1 hypothetical protein [Crocosphaera sp. XPORK-15E]
MNSIISYQKTTQLMVEIYVRSSTHFIINHYSKLLPDWDFYPETVVIILLESAIPLNTVNRDVIKEKKRLRNEFLEWANIIKFHCKKQKWLTEIIDPQDGMPIYSSQGKMGFDVVAVVHELLRFDVNDTKDGCKMLHHPIKKTAIYPSLLLSDAKVKDMNYLLQKTLTTR